MKKAVVVLLGCFVVAGSLFADEPQWLTSFPETLAQAKKENKYALLDFTGSDWCAPCKIIHDKILTSPEFVNYAQKNLVLEVVDFPAQKPQSDELIKANAALQTKYDVDGYPTLLLLRPDGTVAWRNLGYSGETPAQIIAKIDAAKKK